MPEQMFMQLCMVWRNTFFSHNSRDRRSSNEIHWWEIRIGKRKCITYGICHHKMQQWSLSFKSKVDRKIAAGGQKQSFQRYATIHVYALMQTRHITWSQLDKPIFTQVNCCSWSLRVSQTSVTVLLVIPLEKDAHHICFNYFLAIPRRTEFSRPV